MPIFCLLFLSFSTYILNSDNTFIWYDLVLVLYNAFEFEFINQTDLSNRLQYMWYLSPNILYICIILIKDQKKWACKIVYDAFHIYRFSLVLSHFYTALYFPGFSQWSRHFNSCRFRFKLSEVLESVCATLWLVE